MFLLRGVSMGWCVRRGRGKVPPTMMKSYVGDDDMV
jgi:hypothetical protein